MAASDLLVLSTPKAGDYETPGHPESPSRVLASLRHLKSILPAGTIQDPPPADLEKIRAVHGPRLIRDVEGGSYFDPDTPGGTGILAASLLSTGAALRAAEECLAGRKVFSLMRPPGHHATPDQAMGFCYFNSMAVAIQDQSQRDPAKKIAVLDLDCHHGNGTEDFSRGKPEFLYASLHQFPAYPGTGKKSLGNCLNYPLPPGTREGDYFRALEGALREVRLFKPDLVGVSMGFDTYEKDPLTQFGLVKKDYRKIGKTLRDLNLPLFSLLEGGYHDDLPFLIEEFLTGWAG
jgi:acetoin utilization deacetylase AcuC-like enzyme